MKNVEWSIVSSLGTSFIRRDAAEVIQMEIKPMLLTEIWDRAALNDTTKLYQEKFNGVRALVHIKDSRVVGIRNRSNNPILFCFPEFKDVVLPYHTAILDCEICVFKNGKSIFYGGVDQRRSAPADSVVKEYPATIVVFDALKIDNEVLVMKPYSYRYSRLSNIVATPLIKVAENYNGPELWQKVVEGNLEGVVIKNPKAIYEIDKRSKEYLKMKNYKLTSVVVDSIEQNEKGTKIFGVTKIDEVDIKVEAQLAGVFDVGIGTTQFVKYLDICGSRLIQPTKVSREQFGVM